MSDTSSQSFLERQVVLPERRRLWLFVCCCIAASMIGAAGAVVHSLRFAHVIVVEPAHVPKPNERRLASVDSSCPTTTMTAALTHDEWVSVGNDDGSEFSRSMRIVPAIRHGKPDGFKLYAIRPDSIWARIGLQNGDTLQRVQGLSINSPEQALAIYNQLQSQTLTEVNVDLTRDGCPATLQVNLLGRPTATPLPSEGQDQQQ